MDANKPVDGPKGPVDPMEPGGKLYEAIFGETAKQGPQGPVEPKTEENPLGDEMGPARSAAEAEKYIEECPLDEIKGMILMLNGMINAQLRGYTCLTMAGLVHAMEEHTYLIKVYNRRVKGYEDGSGA